MYISEITFLFKIDTISCTSITELFCNTLIIHKSISKPLVKPEESKMLKRFFYNSVTFSLIFNSIADMAPSCSLVKTYFKGLTRPSKNNFKNVINKYF